MARFECTVSSPQSPEKEAGRGPLAAALRWGRSPDRTPALTGKLRPTGVSLFLGGLELWFYMQIHWLSSGFRLQAFGILLLVYWILGALWCLRDRGEALESEWANPQKLVALHVGYDPATEVIGQSQNE